MGWRGAERAERKGEWLEKWLTEAEITRNMQKMHTHLLENYYISSKDEVGTGFTTSEVPSLPMTSTSTPRLN